MPVTYTDQRPVGKDLFFVPLDAQDGYGQWVKGADGVWVYYWSTWQNNSTLDLRAGFPPNGRIVAQGNKGNDLLYGGAGYDYLDGGDGNDSIVSEKGHNTLNGGSGSDWIRTVDLDHPENAKGHDVIDGGDGADTILVGGDLNVITGGTGNDLINATAARFSQIDGGDGDDTIKGSTSNDTILGGAGSDSISTGGGADIVSAGDGNDTIDASFSRSAVINGDGGDDLIYVPANVTSATVNGGGGADTIDGRSPSGKNTSADFSLDLRGGSGNDLILGGDGADTADGGSGNDTVDMGGGDDIAIWFWGEGADSYNGGGGNDQLRINFRSWADYLAHKDEIWTDFVPQFTGGSKSGTIGKLSYSSFEVMPIIYVGSVQVVDTDLPGKNAPLQLQNPPTDKDDLITVRRIGERQDMLQNLSVFLNGLAGDDVYLMAAKSESMLAYFEDKTFDGGDDDDTMVGQNRDDRMRGGSGNDLLIGAEGNDTLFGDAGHDSIDGGAGNDLLGHDSTTKGQSDSSTLSGGNGDDTLYGGGADLLQGGDGNDRIYGGTGRATAMGGNGDDYIAFDIAANAAGNASLNGGSGQDTLLAGAGADTLDGGADADSLSGGDGSDLLIGGAGDDTLSGGDAADTLQGGTGNDSVSGGAGADVLLYSRDVAYTSGYYDVLTGNAGTYVVRLGNDDKTDPSNFGMTQDVYDGGSGDDTLVGTDARDALFFHDQNGRQQVFGIEAFNMGAGDDIIDLTGYGQAVLIFGGAGSDLIAGGSGDDTILGGSGANTLFGGDGNDRFVFSSVASSGSGSTDTILDFKKGDSIWLTDRSDASLEARGASLDLGDSLRALRLADLKTGGISDQSDGVLLTLKSGDHIKIAGVSQSKLKDWHVLG